MYNNKKGQAAMEFLMTYGWAILAAVTAVGVLAAFGVFSPGKMAPTAYVINAPLSIVAGSIEGDSVGASNVKLDFSNGAGEGMVLLGVEVEGCGNSEAGNEASVGTVGNITDAGEYVFLDGDKQILTLYCASGVNSGSNFKGDITITYRKLDSTLPQSSTGSMSDLVR